MTPALVEPPRRTASSRVAPRSLLPVLAVGGAAVLAALPLVRPTDPFDAALRVTVWLAVVVAAAAGAGKPAALFGAVATLVEGCGSVLDAAGPAESWAPVPAALLTVVLVAARKGPAPHRTVARALRRTGR